MKFRQLIKDQLTTRLLNHLPEHLWAQANLNCTIEKLSFKHASSFEDNWQQTATFVGRIRADIYIGDQDQLMTELLVSNLLSDHLIFLPDPATAEGDISEQLRCQLIEWVDNLDESSIDFSLYLNVSGSLVRRIITPNTPELFINQAPEIGLAHQQDYQSINEFGDLLDD